MKKKLLALSVLGVALTVTLALLPVGIAQAKAPLRGTTAYEFVGHLGIVDADGRLLAWEGTTSGDIDGVIRWWVEPGDTFTGQAHHYSIRVEIWDSTATELLLAAEMSGTTTARHGKNSNWRENGVVTEANGDFESWVGRHVHESGHFTWQVIDTPDGPVTIPEAGTSIFRIN